MRGWRLPSPAVNRPRPVVTTGTAPTPARLYRRYREQPVLPFNAYGTMAIAREEFENNSGSSQFFWLLKARPQYPPACLALPATWPVPGSRHRSALCTRPLRPRCCLRTAEL